LRAGDADVDQLVRAVPRTRGHLRVGGEGLVVLRLRVGVLEVVDQLLDAHGVGGWQPAFAQETAHVAVAGGVDVDREGGERLIAHEVEVVLGHVRVGFAVVIGGRHLRAG
jgi:hypothetical protein